MRLSKNVLRWSAVTPFGFDGVPRRSGPGAVRSGGIAPFAVGFLPAETTAWIWDLASVERVQEPLHAELDATDERGTDRFPADLGGRLHRGQRRLEARFHLLERAAAEEAREVRERLDDVEDDLQRRLLDRVPDRREPRLDAFEEELRDLPTDPEKQILGGLHGVTESDVDRVRDLAPVERTRGTSRLRRPRPRARRRSPSLPSSSRRS